MEDGIIFSESELPFAILTKEQALIKSQSKDGPTPYIKDVSWTGEVTIGWSKEIIAIDPTIASNLANERIAIEQQLTADLEKGG